MREQMLRTIGATVVLIGIAVTAILQVGPGGDPSAIALTAESSSTTSSEAAPASTEPAPPSSSTTAPEPFVYRIGVLDGVTTDNFWAFYGDQPSVWNSYILGPTKAALFSIDEAGSIRPELATVVPNPMFTTNGWQVTVDLRDDLFWSDGTPITADDVVFTFDTVRKLQLGGSWADSFPEAVSAISAESPVRLRIEFVEQPTLSSWPQGPGLAPVMSRSFWESQISEGTAEALYQASGADDPAGGPLRLHSIDDGFITSHANPGYPLAVVPDIVEYSIYGADEEMVSALEASHIDYVLSPKGLTVEHTERLEADPSVEVVTSPSNGVRYLGFNLRRAPMSDNAFRSALALLLDRGAVAELSGSSVALSMISPQNARWYSEDQASANYDRYTGPLVDRLGSALAGLRTSGYRWTTEPSVGPNGELLPGAGLTINGLPPAPLTILTPGDAYDVNRPKQAAVIADTLAVLGFDARPVQTDFESVVDLAFTPDEEGNLHYDMYLLGWTLGNPTWPTHYRPLFAQSGPMNNTGYVSDGFETALSAYESAYDEGAAKQALWAMETHLAKDLPYLLLYDSTITEAYRSDRVAFVDVGLGGYQARMAGVLDVKPVG